jgi:hypothetical protein
MMVRAVDMSVQGLSGTVALTSGGRLHPLADTGHAARLSAGDNAHFRNPDLIGSQAARGEQHSARMPRFRGC